MDRQEKTQDRQGEAGRQENEEQRLQQPAQTSGNTNRDRQEGDMHNGELGGNFEEEDSKESPARSAHHE